MKKLVKNIFWVILFCYFLYGGIVWTQPIDENRLQRLINAKPVNAVVDGTQTSAGVFKGIVPGAVAVRQAQLADDQSSVNATAVQEAEKNETVRPVLKQANKALEPAVLFLLGAGLIGFIGVGRKILMIN